MRAEATVPDADAELRAQPGRDERVVHSLDGERRDGQRGLLGRRAEHTDSRDRVEPGPKPACQLAVVTLDLRPPDDVELVDRGVQSDGAEHVRGAGLLPLGRIRPDHFVEVDEIDCTTARQERVTVGERRSRADECTGAERRVHLVAAPGDEVDARRQAAMRCELGCVEEHGYVPLVRGVGDRVDRRHPSGDVRRARDGQELGPRCRVERGDDVVEPERAVAVRTPRTGAGMHAPTATGWRDARRRS